MTVSGSSACQVLVTCKAIDWNSAEGDLVKRAYWHSAILETGLHIELDLPATGLLNDPVSSITSFNGQDVQLSECDEYADEISHYRAHYASQLSLHRLCSDAHDEINESMGLATRTDDTSESFNSSTAKALANLEGKLQQWRDMLPKPLQWPEDDPTVYPDEVHAKFQHKLDPELLEDANPPKLFTAQRPENCRPPRLFPFVYDIQVALLRTRYYYAKYMVYRPYVYKALHFPKLLTLQDKVAVATCLRVRISFLCLVEPHLSCLP